MKKFSILFISLMLLNGNSSFAKDTKTFLPYLKFSHQSTMRTAINIALQQIMNKDSGKVSLYNHPDYILPKKVLLFSAIIPGTGELYCKSYLKSTLFFGIEVGTWVMYTVFHKKGKQKEDEFMAYADEYWNEDKWRAWFNNLTEEEQNVFSHTLPDAKTQQYYEMIGKYDQFLVGWEDADPNLTTSEIHEKDSQLREHYMDMRYDSNKLLKRATTGVYIAMFNHILSAIDAAWTAKRHNNQLIRTSLHFENKYFNYEDHPVLTLKINW